MPFGIPTSEGRRRLATVASATLAIAGASAAFSAPAYAAPSNDMFANAEKIDGTSHFGSASMSGATTEAAEPVHGGTPSAATIWYSWTAPTDMDVSLDGSVEDANAVSQTSTVAVYTGSSLSSLTPVVSKTGSYWSASFAATGGRTYKIAVAGPARSDWTGWTFMAVPSNDAFAAPKVVSSLTGGLTGSNDNGSRETGEPLHAGQRGGASVWYSWTAPSAAQMTFTTAGSGFDTLLGVYKGSAVSSLTEVASNNNCAGATATTTSCVTFNAVRGTTYRLAVDGFSDRTGRISLAWSGGTSCTVTGTEGDDILVGTAGDDMICGLGGDDRIKGLGGNDEVIGGDGIDVASFADSAAGVTADLTIGTATGEGTDTLEAVENLIGSSFDDTLTGDAVANVLSGGLGSDRLVGQGGDDAVSGGGGVDTVSFAGSAAGVTADLTVGTATGQGSDTLQAVENLVGSSFDDILTGDAADNVLDGGLGADRLWGLGGKDNLVGAEGDDMLGGTENDDTVNGGAGSDTAHFGRAAGVTVDLATGVATGEGQDTLLSMENAIGSPGMDRFTGTSGVNLFQGGSGADTLSGAGGDDSLYGAGGADALAGGAGVDRCDGGTERDTATKCETKVDVP